MTRISWESRGFNLQKRPYLAVLEGPDARYTFRRKFVSHGWEKTGEHEDGSEWVLEGATFKGDLEPGTLLESREVVERGETITSYTIVTGSGTKGVTWAQAKRLVVISSAERLEKIAVRVLVEGR